jgi:hypothetical protein
MQKRKYLTQMLVTAIWMAAIAGFMTAGVFEATAAPGDNIARGKPYTMKPRPNYKLCLDKGDVTQLTDGVYSKDGFWTQKGTVGWRSGKPTMITVDLGRVQPIRGASFNSAAGRAGVEWPQPILILVSDDGKLWYFADDLTALSARPPAKGYAKHKYRTNELKTYGRYVMFGVVPGSQYMFCDEVEIIRGDDALLKGDRGKAVTDVMATLLSARITSFTRAQLRVDLDAVAKDITAEATPAAARADLRKRAGELGDRVAKMPALPQPDFKAVLPMNEIERDIFQLQANVWRAQGKPVLRLWQTHRWDMLGPTQEPPAKAKLPTVRVDMMNNESRADVFNITHAGQGEMTVRLRIEGLPGGPNPDYVVPHEVACIGTRSLGAVSSPLPVMKREGDAFVMRIAAGMTRQIWLAFNPDKLPAGRHTGRVVLNCGPIGKLNVPIDLNIWPGRMPDQTTLRVGGWSYTNRDNDRGMTLKNRDALITHLRERRVNTPWARSGAMPTGKYDKAGKLVTPPDTSNFDAWVQRWPDARCFMVFVSVGHHSGTNRTEFGGSKSGTKLFDIKLANWAHFWAAHMRKLGLKPNQLGMLLFDEPHNKEQYEILRTWAKVIQKAEPELVIWVDPTPRAKSPDYLPMMKEMDVLVPHRPSWCNNLDWMPELFEKQQRDGRELGFYSCSGPARSFDPFSYYLLQGWHSFQIGGLWSQFWSFNDTRGAPAWNDYASTSSGAFTPLLLTADGVVADKRMEAIHESAQDFEYLVMLRERVSKLRAKDDQSAAVRNAAKILNTACDRALASMKNPNFRWDAARDRSIVDVVRLDLLKAIKALDAR